VRNRGGIVAWWHRCVVVVPWGDATASSSFGFWPMIHPRRCSKVLICAEKYMAVVCRERLASGRSFSGVRGGEWCSRCNAVHPQERCSHWSGCTACQMMHPDRRNWCIWGYSWWFCLFQGCDCCGFAVSFGHGRSAAVGVLYDDCYGTVSTEVIVVKQE